MPRTLRSILCALLVLSLVPAQAFAVRAPGGTHAAERRAPAAETSRPGHPSHRADWRAPRVAGEIVVGVRAGARATDIVRELRATGFSAKRTLYRGAAIVVSVPEERVGAQTAAKLAALPGVAFAEPNSILRLAAAPNDARYVRQWGLDKIGAPAAWASATGKGVVIAVLDSGIDATHVEFAGRVDTTNDYDFVNNDANAADDNGHGTMVAGIAAAARGNRAYGAGVAPSSTILPVKIAGADGTISNVALAQGIDWAVAHGADVINLSIAGSTGSALVQASIARALAAKVTVVAAAGNMAWGDAQFPAWVAGVISVGASNRNDALAPFSNWGNQIDVVAPGVSIMSSSNDGAAGWADGTSEASPFVAGAAALLLERHPGATPLEVAAAIRRSAHDLGAPGWDARFGSGRLVLNPGATTALTGGDEWEGDDTRATARLVALDRQYDHALSPAGDVDWIAFDALAGINYSVETFELWGAGADTTLGLYDGAGTLLASNDNQTPADPSSKVVWACPATGRYYAAIRDKSGAGGGYGVAVRTDSGIDPAELGGGDDTISSAKKVTVGNYYHRTFYPVPDADYVSFDVVAGKTYEMVTWDLEAPDKVDSRGWLYTPNATGGWTNVVRDVDPANLGKDPLENSTDNFDNNSGVRIVRTASRSETWVLRIENTPGLTGSHYALGVFPVEGRPPVERVWGSDRFSTSVAIARRTFPAYTGVTDVIVACGEDRAVGDAIAAAPLAGVWRAPILLTRASVLPSTVKSAVAQMAAANGGRVNVHVVGGTGSVYPALVTQLDAANGTGTIERINGTDRYALSAAIATRVSTELAKRGEKAPAVLVGAGDNSAAFYDALAVSSAGYASTVPIVLVRKDLVPLSVSRCLSTTFPGQKRYVVNGTAYVGSAVYSAVKASGRASTALNHWTAGYAGTGTNRYRMGESIDYFTLRQHWRATENLGMASKIPDALTGSALLGENASGFVYASTLEMPLLTWEYAINIYGFDYAARKGWVLGGAGSVPETAKQDLGSAIGYMYWP
jgi:hypothetical protein